MQPVAKKLDQRGYNSEETRSKKTRSARKQKVYKSRRDPKLQSRIDQVVAEALARDSVKVVPTDLMGYRHAPLFRNRKVRGSET